jgi:hypothetical protein
LQDLFEGLSRILSHRFTSAGGVIVIRNAT